MNDFMKVLERWLAYVAWEAYGEIDEMKTWEDEVDSEKVVLEVVKRYLKKAADEIFKAAQPGLHVDGTKLKGLGKWDFPPKDAKPEGSE